MGIASYAFGCGLPWGPETVKWSDFDSISASGIIRIVRRLLGRAARYSSVTIEDLDRGRDDSPVRHAEVSMIHSCGLAPAPVRPGLLWSNRRAVTVYLQPWHFRASGKFRDNF